MKAVSSGTYFWLTGLAFIFLLLLLLLLSLLSLLSQRMKTGRTFFLALHSFKILYSSMSQ